MDKPLGGLRGLLTAACVWLALAGAPARGQCTPQELARLIAPDAATDDLFGVSVAVSGDTAVVGAYLSSGDLNAGSAYVFVRSGGGWTFQAKLTADDAAFNDRLGISVAISGDTVVVGAYGDGSPSAYYTGSAYVFTRVGVAWSQQAKLEASDHEAGDNFGYSVAVSGDTAVIGANDDTNAGGPEAGSAYVFVRSGGVWTEQVRLSASDAAVSDHFGVSVALSGDTAVVGANDDDAIAGGNLAGSAYVFLRSGTVWTQQAKLIASDEATDDQFGISVAVSGDTAVVGAYLDDYGSMLNPGSAYVFIRSGTAWTQQAKLIDSEATAGDQFGISVAVSGDIVVVGAYLDNNAPGDFAGSASVFVRSGTVWTQPAKLIGSGSTIDDGFGYSVAVSGDTAVVGSWKDDPSGIGDAGAAYVFSDLTCDADFDGVPDASDCAPLDATVWGAPGPVTDLDAAGYAPTTLTWLAPAAPGATVPWYDLLRSDLRQFAGAVCLESDDIDLMGEDPSTPGTIYYYLVRVETPCGSNLGTNSAGGPRTAPPCP